MRGERHSTAAAGRQQRYTVLYILLPLVLGFSSETSDWPRDMHLAAARSSCQVHSAARHNSMLLLLPMSSAFKNSFPEATAYLPLYQCCTTQPANYAASDLARDPMEEAKAADVTASAAAGDRLPSDAAPPSSMNDLEALDIVKVRRAALRCRSFPLCHLVAAAPFLSVIVALRCPPPSSS